MAPCGLRGHKAQKLPWHPYLVLQHWKDVRLSWLGCAWFYWTPGIFSSYRSNNGSSFWEIYGVLFFRLHITISSKHDAGTLDIFFSMLQRALAGSHLSIIILRVNCSPLLYYSQTKKAHDQVLHEKTGSGCANRELKGNQGQQLMFWILPIDSKVHFAIFARRLYFRP